MIRRRTARRCEPAADVSLSMNVSDSSMETSKQTSMRERFRKVRRVGSRCVRRFQTFLAAALLMYGGLLVMFPSRGASFSILRTLVGVAFCGSEDSAFLREEVAECEASALQLIQSESSPISDDGKEFLKVLSMISVFSSGNGVRLIVIGLVLLVASLSPRSSVRGCVLCCCVPGFLCLGGVLLSIGASSFWISRFFNNQKYGDVVSSFFFNNMLNATVTVPTENLMDAVSVTQHGVFIDALVRDEASWSEWNQSSTGNDSTAEAYQFAGENRVSVPSEYVMKEWFYAVTELQQSLDSAAIARSPLNRTSQRVKCEKLSRVATQAGNKCERRFRSVGNYTDAPIANALSFPESPLLLLNTSGICLLEKHLKCRGFHDGDCLAPGPCLLDAKYVDEETCLSHGREMCSRL